MVQWGWLLSENNLSHHFERYLHDMNMLETPLRFSGEIPIFETFVSEKVNFDLYFAENRLFRSVMFYYLIVTSYVDRFS